MNKLPNFLVVGSAKSGTSTLYYQLLEHPEIYLPKERKELRFFSQMSDIKGPWGDHLNTQITKTFEDYAAFFSDVRNEKVIGEVSPDYLYFYDKSIKNIQKYLSDTTKIVMILRNPIERAYSNYMHFHLDGREDLSFEDACKDEEKRQALSWEWAYSYKNIGLYYKQVKAYIDHFDKVKVYLFDELIEDNKALLKDLYGFLDVDVNFVPNILNERYNASGVPKNKILHLLLNESSNRMNVIRNMLKSLLPEKSRQDIKRYLMNRNLKKTEMRQETRTELADFYRQDVLMLQDLLQRDLSFWLQ